MAHRVQTADRQYDLELGIQQSSEATAYIRNSILQIEEHPDSSDQSSSEEEEEQDCNIGTTLTVDGNNNTVTPSVSPTPHTVNKNINGQGRRRRFSPEDDQKIYVSIKPLLQSKLPPTSKMSRREVIEAIDNAGPHYQELTQRFVPLELYDKARHFLGRMRKGQSAISEASKTELSKNKSS
jgi:hypothetical protein